MPDESGKLTSADIPIIDAFMQRHSPDMCLTCPVTGVRVPLSQWQFSDRLCMLPNSGKHQQMDEKRSTPVLSCTSPAGGMLFVSAVHIGLLIPVRVH